MYICVRGIDFASISTIFFYCGTIPAVWYFFVFHFILFFKGRNDIILHTGSQPFCSFVLLIRLHDLR